MNSDLYLALCESLRTGRLVARATVIAGPGAGRELLAWPDGETLGSLDLEAGEEGIREKLAELFELQQSQRLRIEGGREPSEVFCEVFPPPPKLIIVGAVHVAIHLVTFARELGFRTIVIDPRSAFATPERFSRADELRIEWPHETLGPEDFDESACLAVLSHDEKIDNPALKLALESPCRYIGALGSRRTHGRRLSSLREAGFTDERLSRIHAPIGLDLGGRRPEEIAVAIIAEIVAVRNGAREH